MFHLYKLFYQKVAVTFACLISKAYQKMNSLYFFFLSLSPLFLYTSHKSFAFQNRFHYSQKESAVGAVARVSRKHCYPLVPL